MINWFDMPAEGLSNGGLFEIKELTATENKVYQKDGEVYNKVTVNVPSPTGKITITENGTDIDIAQYATADVNVEGGGGSSDFSTAEVTIQITTENPDVYVAIPAIVTTPVDMILNQQYNTLNSSTAQMLTVPLYKGTLAVTGNSAGEISVNVNGSVQQVGALDFLITGDCTITIS